MQNLQNTLVELLKDDTNYTSAGKLLKNKLTEDALKLESSLLKYLINNDRLKKHFFIDVEGTFVFDKDKFIQFVNDKEFLPDSYTSFRNKIGLLDEDGKYFSEKRDVVLAWPYKDCVLEGGQDKEDQKRNEIFYNEVLAPDEIDRLFDPKVLTNFKRYDKDGEHKNPDDLSMDDNLIIKGNNLLALHSLKKRYRGKVKLIYIDPPYNTGNDSFEYNDRFNHSSWLSFMKTRLQIARELLTKNGFIFISCDDNEQAYLKVVCDEVFGRNNFFTQIIIQSNKRGQTYKQISKTHEYLIVYSKKEGSEVNELKKEENSFEFEDEISEFDIRELRNRNPKYGKFNRPNLFYPIYVNISIQDKDGFSPVSLKREKNFNKVLPLNSSNEESCWRWGEEKVLENIDTNTLASNLVGKQKTTGEYGIYEKYRKTTYKAKTIWSETEVINEQGTVELRKLGLGASFSFPKPSYLIKKIISLATEKDSLILDFFAGSGTTGQAVIECNKEDDGQRQFILIEQLNDANNVLVTRLQKIIELYPQFAIVFYTELKKWNQTYIDEIEDAKTSKQLLTIYKKMKNEAFFRYDVDLSQFPARTTKAGGEENEFSKLELDQQKEVLIECLDKNHLFVNLSEMDDTTYDISDEDKTMNKKFYGLD